MGDSRNVINVFCVLDLLCSFLFLALSIPHGLLISLRPATRSGGSHLTSHLQNCCKANGLLSAGSYWGVTCQGGHTEHVTCDTLSAVLSQWSRGECLPYLRPRTCYVKRWPTPDKSFWLGQPWQKQQHLQPLQKWLQKYHIVCSLDVTKMSKMFNIAKKNSTIWGAYNMKKNVLDIIHFFGQK